MGTLRGAFPVVALLVVGGCCTPPAGHTSTGTLALDPLLLEGEVDEAAIEAWMATEVIVLQSWQIRERAVQRLGLAEPFGTTEMDAVEGLGTALEVARMKGSTVFEVVVTSPDPQASADACNAVMEAYVEYRLERRLEPLLQKEHWLSEQVEQQRQELQVLDPAAAEDLARHRVLLELTSQMLTEVTLERTLMRSDARIVDRCQIPATAP